MKVFDIIAQYCTILYSIVQYVIILYNMLYYNEFHYCTLLCVILYGIAYNIVQ